MKRMLALCVLIAASYVAVGAQIFRPMSVSCTYAGATSAFTITEDTWFDSSYNKLPEDATHAGRSALLAIEAGAVKFWLTKEGGYWSMDYVEVNFPLNSTADSLTLSATSTWGGGSGTMTVTASNPVKFRCSNATGVDVTIDGVEITAATIGMNAIQNPSVTVSSPDIALGAKVYLVKTSTGARKDITSGGTLSGTFYGDYTIEMTTLDRDYPSWIYNDVAGNGSTVLFSPTSNQLLFQYRVVTTNDANIMTEWVFDQSQLSGGALINGVNVCPGHSTTHIIDYNVSTESNWSYEPSTKCWKVSFTMAFAPYTENSGSCVYRCWINDSGTVTTYDAAAANQRASQSGNQSSVMTFYLRINKFTGAKTLSTE